MGFCIPILEQAMKVVWMAKGESNVFNIEKAGIK